MAHFYGSVWGSRGAATRLGGKDAGMNATAASWSGACRVRAYERDGVDMVRVTLGQCQGRGAWPEVVVYDGPIAGPAKAEAAD